MNSQSITDYVDKAKQAVVNAEIDLQRVREINDRKASQRWKKHGNKGVTLQKQDRDIKRLGRAEQRLIEARQFLKAVEEGAKTALEAVAKEVDDGEE